RRRHTRSKRDWSSDVCSSDLNVGMTHDTAEFAVASIRRWWRQFGIRHYPAARHLFICADSGGSNAARNRAWKYYLQKFSDEAKLEIVVGHYPPGTSNVACIVMQSCAGDLPPIPLPV